MPGEQPGSASQPGGGKTRGEQDKNGATGKPDSSGIPNGQGGREGANGEPPKGEDKTQPLPPVTQKSPEGNDPSVAPDVPKTNLVLRKLQDLLKDEKFTPDVEKKIGMTRDEAEQFVRKFEKKEQTAPSRVGETIQSKPGEERVLDPNRKAPEFATSSNAASRLVRKGTTLPQDNLSGLSEGGKSAPPPELRRLYEAYNRSLSNSKVVAPPAPASTPATKR
jgi:hypothetical protein